MKAKDLAARLHSMNLSEFPHDMVDEAKRSGLVVVIGTSKRTVEFYGAIDDQIDIEDGGAIYFDAEGILPDADSVPEAEAQAYYDRKRLAYLIDAEWGQHGFPWSFTTVIPHSRFVVATHDGRRYCRGIVFDIKAIAGGAA